MAIDPVTEHNGDDRCGCLAVAFSMLWSSERDKAQRQLANCQRWHPMSWQLREGEAENQPRATFGDQVRAMNADGQPCKHGDPRGFRGCALCRIKRTA